MHCTDAQKCPFISAKFEQKTSKNAVPQASTGSLPICCVSKSACSFDSSMRRRSRALGSRASSLSSGARALRTLSASLRAFAAALVSSSTLLLSWVGLPSASNLHDERVNYLGTCQLACVSPCLPRLGRRLLIATLLAWTEAFNHHHLNFDGMQHTWTIRHSRSSA